MGGFEVFVITKFEPRLNKMGFVENGTNNLRQKLKESILRILTEKYDTIEADYVSADRIADEQQEFLIIPTSENYDPLSVLKTTPGAFRYRGRNRNCILCSAWREAPLGISASYLFYTDELRGALIFYLLILFEVENKRY